MKHKRYVVVLFRFLKVERVLLFVRKLEMEQYPDDPVFMANSA